MPNFRVSNLKINILLSQAKYVCSKSVLLHRLGDLKGLKESAGRAYYICSISSQLILNTADGREQKPVFSQNFQILGKNSVKVL